MTFTTPCARPENNPDDWFISRDGTRYHDEVLVGELEYADLVALAATVGEEPPSLEEATEGELADRLVARRHARDACHTDCIFRLHCLGLSEDEDHGIWGGYYPEERRAMWKLRAEKRAERAARAVAAEE